MTTATLTPQSDQTPAVVNVVNELSGAVWVPRFPAQNTTDHLTADFQAAVDGFIAALQAGGAEVRIANTFRPKERAYMMHWAHKIARNGVDPATVPAMDGVHINWVHPTLEQSVAGATAMVNGFGIQGLGINTPPALNTLHGTGEAIDMSITWTGNITVANKDGSTVEVNTAPRTGMNTQLKEIGATYGVTKFVGGNSDKPHWSTTGH